MRVACLIFAFSIWAMPAAGQVSGTVVDDSSGLPIEGARVTLRATDIRTETDASGRYDLPVPDGDTRIVGAARGYFNRGGFVVAPATGVELRLDAVHPDDATGSLEDPSDCMLCHLELWSQWTDSRMQTAGRNTWVLDMYDGSGTSGGDGGFVYARDSTEAATNPTSECAACHQPVRWLTGAPIGLAPADDPSSDVAHGVACGVCHQMADNDLTRPNSPGIDLGVVRMTRSSDPLLVVMYGVYGDVDFASIGQMRASLNPQLTSGVCAACHQDANDPDRDGDREEASSVVSGPTYVEWLESPYADPASPSYATCADCHMPPTELRLACSVSPGYERELGRVRSHRIVGTTPAFLEDAVTLSLDTTRTGAVLTVEVGVNNHGAGHHVPTGATMRNVILLVEASVGGVPLEHMGDQVISDLAGVGDPAEGYFAGLPGKVYAKRNHGADGTGPVFFTDATGITEDTRIPALATDVTSYTFAAPDADATIEVRARLIYRRAWRALVDAKGWTENGHGEPLEDIAPPHFGHLMEEAEVVLSPPPPDAGVLLDAGVEEPPGGGCGCVTPGGAPVSPWPLGLVVLAWLLRRRRG